ncbi:MAG: UDP-N-acetylmuramate--L-alanine ligase [Gemmatimonadetes bacterium]|nr:MAG: UDP-N-acetylmuramate--L-alanine ligase [Gemmatimonadota bacterium]
MTLFRTGDPRPIHFMGIAGAGMSALAMIARHRGVSITGCDSDTSAGGANDLTALGVRVWQGHDPSHVEGARAVVVTAAVPRDHPELDNARALGLPIVRRADALGELVAGGTEGVVAVAGTHGKTTTTVMVTEALTAAGRNPTGLAGGRVAAWGGNAHIGGDALYVVEADEYDKSFLSLRPTVAVVNNVEADHLECYGSMEALEEAFAVFASRAQRVIVGADDSGADRVALRIDAPVWRVGHGATADVRIRAVRLEPGGSRANISLPSGQTIELALAVPGLHNVRNAAAALGVLQALGADVALGAAALSEFRGVGRRFERLGEAGGVTVVDDYAHHPTEVAATLAAARQAFPGRRVIAVFQPHLFSRTALHGEALGKALAAADMVVVAPIYAAREQPQDGVTHHLVVRGATRAGAATVAVRDRAGVTTHVARAVREGDVVFTLGAGDITRVGPELLKLLGGGGGAGGVGTQQGAVA